MSSFLDKIRRLDHTQRKLMLIEEAWQAISKEGMASLSVIYTERQENTLVKLRSLLRNQMILSEISISRIL